jgi:hypothetical protein
LWNGLRHLANLCLSAGPQYFSGLRVTWITLALASGVPFELVQRVTRHWTVEVVMKHCFKPGGGFPSGSFEKHASDDERKGWGIGQGMYAGNS